VITGINNIPPPTPSKPANRPPKEPKSKSHKNPEVIKSVAILMDAKVNSVDAFNIFKGCSIDLF
jgi:hypothetical protein